jgi:hypothetical protein
MAQEITVAGRLISVDGSRGKDVNAAAAAIAAAIRKTGVDCAISRWDASGLFGELLVAAPYEQDASVRTLSLVYAADLAFRLRWEIRPVLDAGGIVVAAGYVETAVAFGASCGLSEEWLRQLLRFAPAADLRGRSEERKSARPWKRRTDRGYPEYAARMVAASAANTASKRTRQDMIRRLDELRGRRTFTLTKKGIAAIVEAATGSRPAAPRRSA